MRSSVPLDVLAILSLNILLTNGQTSTPPPGSARSSSISLGTTSFIPISTPSPVATTSPDPWQCATSNITQYFDVQKPTGSLLDALDSFVETLIAPCISTATGMDMLSCSVTDTRQYCGFERRAEPTIRSSYSTYGSAAASWYGSKSAEIDQVRVKCPVTWNKIGGGGNEAWLNYTIAHAKCYEQAHGKTNTTTTSSASRSR